MMNGYDINLAQKFIENSNIPITILGGAGSLDNLENLMSKFGLLAQLQVAYLFSKVSIELYLLIIQVLMIN